jgi:hypothetical protein
MLGLRRVKRCTRSFDDGTQSLRTLAPNAKRYRFLVQEAAAAPGLSAVALAERLSPLDVDCQRDASYRLLQPTYNSCTHKASDSRAWGFRRHRPTPRARGFLNRSHQCRTAGAGLPCGNSAPDRCALDYAHRASGPLLTSPRGSLGEPRTAPGGCSRAAALSTACTVELRTPLTPSVALHPPRQAERRSTRTVVSALSSTSSDPSRFRVPSFDECSR